MTGGISNNVVSFIQKNIDEGMQKELNQNEIEEGLKKELEKMLSKKVMSKTPEEKSPEERFRDSIDAKEELPYLKQSKIANNAQNNPNQEQPKDRDNDDSPPPDTILIY